MKGLYLCEICNTYYEDRKKAEACEAQGRPQKFELSEVVLFHRRTLRCVGEDPSDGTYVKHEWVEAVIRRTYSIEGRERWDRHYGEQEDYHETAKLRAASYQRMKHQVRFKMEIVDAAYRQWTASCP